MHLSLVSLDSAWEQPARNLETCHEYARAAAARGARFVIFPEMTLTGFTMQATSFAEPPDDSPTIRAFADIAGDCDVAIAFGMILQGAARPRNHLVVVDANREVLASYAKVHPFSFAEEDEHYEAGGAPVSTRVDDVAFGLSVCYDLRFPELYRALAPECDALLVIANWPEARLAQWYALLTARAIENQAYVIGVNRTGTDGNGLTYPRSSAVIDPAGNPLTPAWTDGVLDGFTLQLGRVREQRQAFPFLRDANHAAYAEWLRTRLAAGAPDLA